MKRHLVVLTGAGMSAESGIATFRGTGGLWEGYDVTEVASPQGWEKNPELVLDFYNQRRRIIKSAQPNKGHKILAELEEYYKVTIITQNIDDLHERGGSSQVIHLHGSIMESRSTYDENLVYPISGDQLRLGDYCEKGYQLRPNIVWFGEMVPLMEYAVNIASQADLFLIVGTSLLVYPAASLIHFTQPHINKYLIDPNIPKIHSVDNLQTIQDGAENGLEKLKMVLTKTI